MKTYSVVLIGNIGPRSPPPVSFVESRAILKRDNQSIKVDQRNTIVCTTCTSLRNNYTNYIFKHNFYIIHTKIIGMGPKHRAVNKSWWQLCGVSHCVVKLLCGIFEISIGQCHGPNIIQKGLPPLRVSILGHRGLFQEQVNASTHVSHGTFQFSILFRFAIIIHNHTATAIPCPSDGTSSTLSWN